MALTSHQRQALSWLAVLLVVLLLMWLLAPVMMPFVIALVMGYVLHPAVRWLVRRGMPKALAVTLVVVGAAMLSLSVLLLVVPVITQQVPMLKAQLPLLVDKANAALSPLLAQIGINVRFDWDGFKHMLGQADWEGLSSRLLESARIGGSWLLTVLGNLVLVPLVLFYLLLDWPRLMGMANQLVPPRVRPGWESFLSECDQVLGQYLRGQLLVMLVLATYYAGALMLAGFHLALPVGVFTGLAVFIPYLGFGLGLIMALLAALLQFGDWYGLIAVAVIYGFGQILESFYLTPRWVGESIGLHPVAVVFALMAFGQLLGFVGVLMALPLAAVALVAVRRIRTAYLASDMYNG